jgi:hypothetical protein
LKTFDLSAQVIGANGMKLVVGTGPEAKPLTLLGLAIQCLWENSGDLKTRIKRGIKAKRLEEAKDASQVELSDDDVAEIAAAMEGISISAKMTWQLLEVINPAMLVEKE